MPSISGLPDPPGPNLFAAFIRLIIACAGAVLIWLVMISLCFDLDRAYIIWSTIGLRRGA